MPVVKFFPFFVLAIGLLESKKRKRDIPKKRKRRAAREHSSDSRGKGALRSLAWVDGHIAREHAQTF